MKRKFRDTILGIEEALTAAHRMRHVPAPDDSFAGEVMFQVRNMGRHPLDTSTKIPPGPPLQKGGEIEPRAVWGFAAASGVLALGFLFYSLSIDFTGVQYQVAQSILGDSSTLMLAETFAII